MGAIVIAILMPVLAQPNQASAADVYEITPKDGTESYFAYVKDATTDMLQLQVYYKPGNNPGDTLTVSKNKVSYGPVGQEVADKEIERRRNKVSQVINGVRVPNAEVERARLADEWARRLEQKLDIPDPTPADPALDAGVPNADPGPLTHRGPQIALVVGALLLIGIIVKLVIVS